MYGVGRYSVMLFFRCNSCNVKWLCIHEYSQKQLLQKASKKRGEEIRNTHILSTREHESMHINIFKIHSLTIKTIPNREKAVMTCANQSKVEKEGLNFPVTVAEVSSEVQVLTLV
jgi:hypothetical protein